MTFVDVRHRRTGELGVLELCSDCLVNRDGTWRLTFEEVESA